MVANPTESAPKPRVWTVFIAYAAAFGAMSSGGGLVLVVALVVLQAKLPNQPDPQAISELIKTVSTAPWFLLASGTISALVLGGIALTAARMSPAGVRERLRLGRAGVGDRGLAVALLTSVAALAAGSTAMSTLTLIFGKRSEALTGLELAVRSTGPMLLLTLLIIAVAAPVAEELFFRGYAQTRLVARYGRRTGMLVATALFALFHFDPMHSAVAFAIGAVLAWTTERTGSIRASIVAHAVNNALFVAGAQAQAQAEAPQTPPTWATAVGLGLASGVALFGIARLTRTEQTAQVA